MVANIIRPMPNTTKFDTKVKVFLKLFNLSYDQRIVTRRFREHVKDGTKLI